MPHHHSIHALHGFLGHSSDWKSSLFFDETTSLHAYNLFDFPLVSFDQWAESFNQKSSENTQGENNQILMGYSLGGRLGLHALLHPSSTWRAAIFVSTHPGLKAIEERLQRKKADLIWAERFQTEPWDAVMNAWNAQDVFKHSTFSFKRNEFDHQRESLSYALREWSLGMQEDLSEAIASLQLPVMWVVGERDTKFLNTAIKLTFKHPKSRLQVVANAGHRLPFEQPEEYSEIVTQFIKNLENEL
jgi:2-succinyl-6-hydroxy-2,4-cyclohexadiene-1-carboxylate synthase